MLPLHFEARRWRRGDVPHACACASFACHPTTHSYKSFLCPTFMENVFTSLLKCFNSLYNADAGDILEENNEDYYTMHYSVCASLAMTAKNSSSREDWVVKSSLRRQILIRPCESPVATT